MSPEWRAALIKHAPISVVLTDKFPSDVLSARLGVDPYLSCANFPVDAARVPESLKGFRTIFSSFHHFSDTVARDVLGDAVRCGDGFAMAEVTSRTPRALATMLLMPIFDWILTPRMRPFRWSRLLFTYLLPLIPSGGLVGWHHFLPSHPYTGGVADPDQQLSAIRMEGRLRPRRLALPGLSDRGAKTHVKKHWRVPHVRPSVHGR